MKKLMAILVLVLSALPINAICAQGSGKPYAALDSYSIASPPGLVSVLANPKAKAWLMRVAVRPGMNMSDGFMTQEDVDRLEAGKSPIGHRFIIALQSLDPRFRFVDERLFNRMAANERAPHFNKQFIHEANGELKADADKGESVKGGQIDAVSAENMLIDKRNCFSKFAIAQYSINGDAPKFTGNLLQTYARIRGQLFIIDAIAASDSHADQAWLMGDVKSWLLSLPVDG